MLPLRLASRNSPTWQTSTRTKLHREVSWRQETGSFTPNMPAWVTVQQATSANPTNPWFDGNCRERNRYALAYRLTRGWANKINGNNVTPSNRRVIPVSGTWTGPIWILDCRGWSKREKYTCGLRGGGTKEKGSELVRKPLMLDEPAKPAAPAGSRELPKALATAAPATAMTGPLPRFNENEV